MLVHTLAVHDERCSTDDKRCSKSLSVSVSRVEPLHSVRPGSAPASRTPIVVHTLAVHDERWSTVPGRLFRSRSVSVSRVGPFRWGKHVRKCEAAGLDSVPYRLGDSFSGQGWCPCVAEQVRCEEGVFGVGLSPQGTPVVPPCKGHPKKVQRARHGAGHVDYWSGSRASAKRDRGSAAIRPTKQKVPGAHAARHGRTCRKAAAGVVRNAC